MTGTAIIIMVRYIHKGMGKQAIVSNAENVKKPVRKDLEIRTL